MADTEKPSEVRSATSKDENVEYNPVNMAGRKAGDMKDIDKYNDELDGGVDLYSVRRDQSQKGK